MKDIKEIIKELIKKKGSLRSCAEGIGIDHANLIRLLRKEGDPRLKTVERILNYFGYTLSVKRKKERR